MTSYHIALRMARTSASSQCDKTKGSPTIRLQQPRFDIRNWDFYWHISGYVELGHSKQSCKTPGLEIIKHFHAHS